MRFLWGLILALSTSAYGSFIGSISMPAGSFNSPNLTGTPTFYTSLMTMSNGGDRIQFNSDNFEFRTAAGQTRLFIAKTDPQVSIIGDTDGWMEPVSGSGQMVGFSCSIHGRCDLGWSTIQQNVLPGARGFRDLWLSRKIAFSSSSANYTDGYGFFYNGGDRMQQKFGQIDLQNTGGSRAVEFQFSNNVISSTGMSFRFNNAGDGLQYYNTNQRFGNSTLVAGVKALSIASATTSTECHADLIDINGSTAIGAQLECKATSGTITVRSRKLDTTTETNDVSKFSYILVEPNG